MSEFLQGKVFLQGKGAHESGVVDEVKGGVQDAHTVPDN
jgi:hypothetical protein